MNSLVPVNQSRVIATVPVKEWFSAQEIADALVRLRLNVMPQTKQGVINYIKRNDWHSFADQHRERSARGGGYEYHISLLPDALRAAILAERSTEITLVETQAKKNRELAKRSALSTATLSARQREVMNARATILSAIEMLQVRHGMSQRQAIQAFIADPDAVGIFDALIVTANDRASNRASSRGATVSRATIYDWFKKRDEIGLGALAPLPTKEKQEIPSWFWQFLRFYAQPQKPALSESLEKFLKVWPAKLPKPNYDQVRRLMTRLDESFGTLERHRGREGSLTLKSRMAYVMRSTDDLLPTCVYTADGKTFDAEVQHPIHGQPFRPEITSIVDVATRKCVGFSIGLAENTIGVVDALRHACEMNGIPAIFYVDRGPGFKNETLDNHLTGVIGRLGITKLHSLPYNSQARGIIERFNGSVWNPLAKEFSTYIGADMDRQAKQRSFKETRRELKAFGTSRSLPSVEEFLTACRNAIASYNAKPHSELPGKMSPNQYWEYHQSKGFEIVPVLESESNDLFRPYVRRKTNRALVEFIGNSYFHLDLERYHGEYVLVGYDIHDASKVWVREIETMDGEEAMGRLICIAIFAGNEERYIPLTMERAALEKRANARAKRLNDHLAEVEAELSPARFLEASATASMPIIDVTPEPVSAPNVEILADYQKPVEPQAPKRRTFASDEELAAWAIQNPESLTSNQVRVLRGCLQQPTAIELFRLSGIDVDTLRNIIRAAA